VEACLARAGYVAGEGILPEAYAELRQQAPGNGLHTECLNTGLRQSGLTAVMDSFAGLIGLMIAKTYFSA
jgi:hypothetical protein